MNKRLKIGLVFNQKPKKTDKEDKNLSDTYAEWDSHETINAVANALKNGTNGTGPRDVVLIEANDKMFNRFIKEKPDIVFNMAEGFRGASREAQVPAILDMLNIPYTGSDPVTLGICLDKQRTKEILSFHNIPTAKFLAATSCKELENIFLPAVVKPVWEGSSKGIVNSSLVRTEKELKVQVERIVKNYKQPALIEEFLNGREFTAAVLGNNDSVRVLPIVEIKLDKLPAGANKMYSYEAKWIWDTNVKPLDIFECPAKISPGLKKKIEDLCKKAFNVLRCRDWCRIDVRLDKKGEPHVIELNPLPGVLPNPEDNSCFPKAARSAGISYNEMINSVLDNAIKRTGENW
ncbi:MAG: ATP-grasp domain-containing protein [bacterium]